MGEGISAKCRGFNWAFFGVEIFWGRWNERGRFEDLKKPEKTETPIMLKAWSFFGEKSPGKVGCVNNSPLPVEFSGNAKSSEGNSKAGAK